MYYYYYYYLMLYLENNLFSRNNELLCNSQITCLAKANEHLRDPQIALVCICRSETKNCIKLAIVLVIHQ